MFKGTQTITWILYVQGIKSCQAIGNEIHLTNSPELHNAFKGTKVLSDIKMNFNPVKETGHWETRNYSCDMMTD